MNELKELLKDIEKLRANLIKLIEEKENLQDPHIVAASQILNAAITKYNDFIKNKK
jgi:regulator of replication initiation timing